MRLAIVIKSEYKLLRLKTNLNKSPKSFCISVLMENLVNRYTCRSFRFFVGGKPVNNFSVFFFLPINFLFFEATVILASMFSIDVISVQLPHNS